MALTAYGVAVAVKPKDEDTLRQSAGRVELRHSDLEAASRGACASWWIGGGLKSRWRGSVSQRKSCSANRPKCERSGGHVVSVLTVA